MQGEGKENLEEYVKQRGLVQVSDPSAIEAMVDKVLASNPMQLEQYRSGKTKLQAFFVGCASDLPADSLTCLPVRIV